MTHPDERFQEVITCNSDVCRYRRDMPHNKDHRKFRDVKNIFMYDQNDFGYGYTVAIQ